MQEREAPYVPDLACLRGRIGDQRGRTMNELVYSYLPVLIFAAIGGFIALVLFVVPFLVAPGKPDSEKVSAYECGFNPFDDARMKFDVRFYLIAILFIIFDLEAIFSVSLGCVLQGNRGAWLLDHDGLYCRAGDWFYLCLAQGSSRMGLIVSPCYSPSNEGARGPTPSHNDPFFTM